MRIQLMSDIHTEFHPDAGKIWASDLDPSGVDVLVIAGDLGNIQTFPTALAMLCEKFQHVVYVNGNHELYGGSFAKVASIRDKLSSRLANLHWLQNDTVTIDEQRFIGSTMWFQHKFDNVIYHYTMNDFRAIADFARDVYNENDKCVKFFHETMRPDDIVVTHHLPHPLSVSKKFRTGPMSMMNRFYLCDMSKLLHKIQPKLWLHGHSHESADYMVENTRIVCNPHGYVNHSMNENFIEKCVIDA